MTQPTRPSPAPVLQPDCPCCGAPMAAAVALDAVPWFVGPTLAAIVRTLRRAGGGPLHIDALAAAVYSRDHGCPINAAGAARQAIRRDQGKLARLGWEVVNLPHAHGFVLRRVRVNGQTGAKVPDFQGGAS